MSDYITPNKKYKLYEDSKYSLLIPHSTKKRKLDENQRTNSEFAIVNENSVVRKLPLRVKRRVDRSHNDESNYKS